MRKLLFCFLLICSSIVLFANDITKADIIGKEKRFQINHSWVYIEFLDENQYTFCSPYGGYLHRKYNYTLVGNKLTLEYCDENIYYLGQDIQPLIFPEKKDVTYEWDSKYIDFYCTGAFIHGKTIFINFATPTPVGTECILNEAKVIKQSGQEKVVALENLRLRERPSLSAPTAYFNYTGMMLINMYSTNDEDRQFIANKINFENEIKMQILIAGLAVEYDAITSFEETIDGIQAPWYRILLYNYSEEGADETFWVFGGYLEKENKEKDYKKLIFDNAKIKGLIK